jgi:hypothetical protein
MSASRVVAAAGLAFALALAPACEKSKTSSADVELVVTPRSMATLEARVEKVMNGPEAQQAMDALFEAIAADPALGAIAGEFGEKLIAHPDIARAIEELIGEIGQSPALMSWMVRYMEAHPGITPDQAGEAVGVEVEKRFEAVLAKPVQDEIGRVVERAQAAKGVAAIEKHMSAQFGRVVDSYFEEPARKARWSKRLVELNGGSRPDPGRAADLYIDHAWSEERIQRFVVRACADPEVRRALVSALRDVLRDPTLRGHLERATRTLATDPLLRRAAINLFALLLEDRASPDEASAAVQALFAAPAVITVVNDLGEQMLAEPTLHQILDDAIVEAARQPSVRKAIDELCDGW